MSRFDLWPGEVLGIVGESGSGKTTLLQLPVRRGLRAGRRHGRLPRAGSGTVDVHGLSERSAPPAAARTEWGFVHQDPRDGLRMGVSRRRPISASG